MPALPADIGAALRDAATAGWSDPAIAARYPSARDGVADPAEGWCDALADAAALVTARAALIGVDGRRRTKIEVAALVWPTISTGLPQVRVVDAELQLDAAHLVARLQIDLEAETTSFETFG